MCVCVCVCVCVCICVCVVIPLILDVRLVDVPAGVTKEEGYTGYLHLPSAVLASVFLARRIQPLLSLVDREVEFCVLTNQSFSTYWTFFIYFLLFHFLSGKIPVRVTAPRFDPTPQRPKVSRLPTVPPGRPASATIKLHITARSSPVILVILCHSHWSSQGGINDTYYENL